MNLSSVSEATSRLASGATLQLLRRAPAKVKEIAAGWRYTLLPVEEIESLALERGAVCRSCPHSTETKCGLCGCPLKAKIRSPGSACPDGRWTR